MVRSLSIRLEAVTHSVKVNVIDVESDGSSIWSVKGKITV